MGMRWEQHVEQIFVKMLFGRLGKKTDRLGYIGIDETVILNGS
jgi:hypothetical protein